MGETEIEIKQYTVIDQINKVQVYHLVTAAPQVESHALWH